MSEVECSVECHQPCFHVTCILGRSCLGNSQRQDSWQTAISLYRNLLNIRERVHQHFAPQIPDRYFRNFILNNKQLERPHLYDTICERSAVQSAVTPYNLTLSKQSTDFRRETRAKHKQQNKHQMNETLK